MSKNKDNSGTFKKRINYSVGYLLLIVAVVVVFVVVNIILEQLPMTLDFTTNEQFSITEETEKILENLKEDVEIIALYTWRINDYLLLFFNRKLESFPGRSGFSDGLVLYRINQKYETCPGKEYSLSCNWFS